jgi:alanine dehydrogenase
MRIGIPREVKPREGRVALIPRDCATLVQQGHEVYLEAGAGVASGYEDRDYVEQGVQICADAASLYAQGELIVKVKEPYAGDLQHLRPDHLLFCFLHLAADPDLTRRLADIGLTAIGFETVQRNGGLPLLAPMSVIAGKIAIQFGSTQLYCHNEGKGVLLGGLNGSECGNVLVLGAGHAGGAAARLAASMGAHVTVMDINPQRLEELEGYSEKISGVRSEHEALCELMRETDILVGSVLLPGARAPHLVSREMVASMAQGSVIVDIAIDQGGCVETSHPTTYIEPTYIIDDVIHFSVTNMPGAVPRSASQALSAVILPDVLRLAKPDWENDAGLKAGINLQAGEIINPVILSAINEVQSNN